MTCPRAPGAGARLGIGLAVLVLADRADRDRYTREFAAELYGLPRTRQLRHVAGFLSHAVALRAALGASPSPLEENAVPAIPMVRRFRCRALRRHDWHQFSTEDGGLYEVCTVCHRDNPGAGPNGAYYGAFAGAV